MISTKKSMTPAIFVVVEVCLPSAAMSIANCPSVGRYAFMVRPSIMNSNSSSASCCSIAVVNSFMPSLSLGAPSVEGTLGGSNSPL